MGGGRDGRILEVEFLSDDESSHENIDWQHVHRRKFLDWSMKVQWHCDWGLLMSKTPLQYVSRFRNMILRQTHNTIWACPYGCPWSRNFYLPSQVPPNILISLGAGPSIIFFHMEIKAESQFLVVHTKQHNTTNTKPINFRLSSSSGMSRHSTVTNIAYITKYNRNTHALYLHQEERHSVCSEWSRKLHIFHFGFNLCHFSTSLMFLLSIYSSN